MSLSAQSTSHRVNGLLHSPENLRSQQTPGFLSSSVSTIPCPHPFIYTPQKQPMSLQSLSTASMGPYDPVIPRVNTMFEEYIKMCNKHDTWHARYIELK